MELSFWNRFCRFRSPNCRLLTNNLPVRVEHGSFPEDPSPCESDNLANNGIISGDSDRNQAPIERRTPRQPSLPSKHSRNKETRVRVSMTGTRKENIMTTFSSYLIGLRGTMIHQVRTSNNCILQLHHSNPLTRPRFSLWTKPRSFLFSLS